VCDVYGVTTWRPWRGHIAAAASELQLDGCKHNAVHIYTQLTQLLLYACFFADYLVFAVL